MGKNWSNTLLYCEQLEKGKRAIESSEELPSLARAGETAAFGLRMNAGWPFELFESLTGVDLRKEWAAEIHELVAGTKKGRERDDERILIHTTGLVSQDVALAHFLYERALATGLGVWLPAA